MLLQRLWRWPNIIQSPVSTRCWTNISAMLVQRLRRWPNMTPTLDQTLMIQRFVSVSQRPCLNLTKYQLIYPGLLDTLSGLLLFLKPSECDSSRLGCGILPPPPPPPRGYLQALWYAVLFKSWCVRCRTLKLFQNRFVVTPTSCHARACRFVLCSCIKGFKIGISSPLNFIQNFWGPPWPRGGMQLDLFVHKVGLNSITLYLHISKLSDFFF